MRALPIALALLALTAPVGGAALAAGPAAGGGTADAGPVPATAGLPAPAQADSPGPPPYRVLTIPPDRSSRVAIDARDADLGTAVGLEVADTTGALDAAEVRERIEAADSPDERQRRLVAAVSAVEQREITLHQRQRDAIAAHAAGDISDRELLAELAAVTAEANALRERLEVLEALADETPGYTLDAGELEFRLRTYDGPIRAAAVGATRADRPPERLYVESGEDALVLAAVLGDTYVREVYRGDNWDRAASGFAGPEDAERVARSAYPETAAAATRTEARGQGGVFRVTFDFPAGDLKTFVSAGSERVIVEHQTRPLATFEPGPARSRVQDGLAVTVNRTYPGGPVRIAVADDDDGDPVEGATVTVAPGDADSEVVGTTDADGVVWALSPHEPYRVTVLGDGPTAAFVADVQPTRPPTVVESDGKGGEDDGGDEGGTA